MDENNTNLGRLLSVEVFGSLIVTAFLVGISWATLSAQASGTETRVSSMETKQAEMTATLTHIGGDVREMKATQKHFKEDMDEIKGDLKEVLKELRETNQRTQ